MLRTLFAFARPMKANLKYNNKANISSLVKPIYFKFSTNKPNDQKDEKKQQKQKEIIEKVEEEKQVLKEEQIKQEIKVQQENLSVGKKAWNFVVDSWKHTFPDEEYQFKRIQQKRKNSIKQTANKKKIQQEERQAQQKTIMQNNALVGLKNQKLQKQKKQTKGKTRKSGFIASQEGVKGLGNAINTIKGSSYFTQNIVDNIKTGKGKIGKGLETITAFIDNRSSVAKATLQMRKIYKDFESTQVEIEAKFIFLKTYNQFLKGNFQFVEQNCTGQAIVYFKNLQQINKVRNVKAYSPELTNPGNITLIDAVVFQGENQNQNQINQIPSFVFQLSAQQTVCFVDIKDGKIVDGDPSRVEQSIYRFIIKYSQQSQNQTGQPWQLSQIIKADSTPLLV